MNKIVTKGHENKGDKTRPDNFSGCSVSIHLGKNVSKDITNWENKYGTSKNKRAYLYELYGNGVGNHQYRNKENADVEEILAIHISD